MTSFTGPDGQEDMPYLLTLGPVTTSRNVKFAMLADWDPCDAEFSRLIKSLSARLKTLAGCDGAYECVFMAGTNETGIEAALGTLTPAKRKKTLMLSNGPQGQRAIQIMQRMGRNHTALEKPELTILRPADIAKLLDEDRNITHVWLVHCEASTGYANPIAEISTVVKTRGRILMVDATTSFGGVPLSMVDDGIDVLLSCPHICLESIPGFSFVIARSELLEAAKNESPSQSLDLHALWAHFQATGAFRETPPAHALVALQQALRELEAEGGAMGRNQRYRATADAFTTRIRALGFATLLPDADRSAIVQTVLSPRDTNFDITLFRDKLRNSGFAISEGALARRPSFRIGTIGQVDEKHMMQLTAAIEAVMNDMNVRDFAPAGT